MKSTREISQATVPDDRRRLAWCFGAALIGELVVLTAVAWHNHWLAHPQKTTGLDESRFVEAQVFEVPKETAHLTAPAIAKSAVSHEMAVSKIPDSGRTAKPGEKPIEENNQTQSESAVPAAPTHGPVAVFMPSPVIPAYLQDQNLKTSVVIEFLVSGQGAVTPRLLASSGNEELDAIALATAKQWHFRPAEQDHKPIDAKVRLRILFEVK